MEYVLNYQIKTEQEPMMVLKWLVNACQNIRWLSFAGHVTLIPNPIFWDLVIIPVFKLISLQLGSYNRILYELYSKTVFRSHAHFNSSSNNNSTDR